MRKLHIFDMDSTLIDADCDLTWKRFLVRHHFAPLSALAEADRFMADYDAGVLDMEEFNAFQLREFVGRTPEEMAELAQLHFDEFIRPACRPGAERRVGEVAAAGAWAAVLTSTCSEIARPVAEFFGISELYGTPLELRDGRFTGAIAGAYYAGPAKVDAARMIAGKHQLEISDVAAYGDSINDLPLLKAAGEAYAVNPSAELRAEAERRGWPVLDWNRR